MKKSGSQLNLFIFLMFFKISLFVIGGGLAMLPVIEEEFSKKRKLLAQKDILDMIAMTQTVPGLIAVNSAVFVGHKLNGLWGMVSAVFGVICPSLFIIMTIAGLFPLLAIKNPVILSSFECIRAAVTAIFIMTTIRLSKKIIHRPLDVFVVIGLFIALLVGINAVYLILTAISIALVVSMKEYCAERKIP